MQDNHRFRDEKGQFLPGHPGPGRPKGSKNIVTKDILNDFLRAYDRLGGLNGLLKWARKNNRNLSMFYQFMAKLIPQKLVEDMTIKEERKSLEIMYIEVENTVYQKRVRELEEHIENYERLVEGLGAKPLTRLPPFDDKKYKRVMTEKEIEEKCYGQ